MRTLLILATACAPGAAPDTPVDTDVPRVVVIAPRNPPAPFSRDAQVVYRVRAGQTLSEIAAECRVPGGAITLAAWNSLPDPDLVLADTALLLPAGSPCTTPTVPATLPRYTAPWSGCTLQWRDLVPANDAPFAGVTIEDVSLVDIDALMLARRACTKPIDGLEVCWRPDKSPGLEARSHGVVLWSDPTHYGDSASGGAPPVYAEHDLDGDGDDEIIVEQRLGCSNGISMTAHRVLVFEDATTAPVIAETLFYDETGWRRAAHGGCELLEVDKLILDDPMRGTGNYFVGVPLRWTGAAFTPAPDPTFPAQRLLDSFFAETFSSYRPAHDWLFDGSAEARPMSEVRQRR